MQSSDVALHAGFVALSENKEDIAVVFRGTCVAQEWLSNFTVFVTSWDEVDKTEPVIAGKKIQKSVWVETVILSSCNCPCSGVN